jgi:hypothetical protein
MTGYHTRWVRPETEADDPERLAIRESLAFGKALYDRRTALGLSVTCLTAGICAWVTSAAGVTAARYVVGEWSRSPDSCRKLRRLVT